MLNVHKISHPHTGIMIANKVESILKAWNIQKHKILLMIINNGSNMQKAVHELQKSNVEQEGNSSDLNEDGGLENFEDSSSSDEDEGMTKIESESADNNTEEEVIVSSICGLSFLAHSLQLIVKDGLKVPEIQSLLAKCHSIVRKVRTSSVATEKLLL